MQRKLCFVLLEVFCLINSHFALPEHPEQFSSSYNLTTSEEDGRDKKFLNLFSVIKFPNNPCLGGSKNGTCYTAEECTSIGGKSDGTCASGFGVCCTITLDCGGSSSQNNTFIVQSSSTSVDKNPCLYTINKNNPDICRIRFDFTTFTIEGPTEGTTEATSTVTVTGSGIGDCTGDMFTITSPGRAAPPVICGYNTGQHMIVDASDFGHVLSFALSSSTSVTRSWDIQVIQYECGSPVAGPPGCLQYFTAVTGTVANFNFPTAASTVSATVTHLSNQHYSMCFRRGSGNCAICFLPVRPTQSGAADQASFGLGISADKAAAQSMIDGTCVSDYIGIPNGVVAATAAIATITTPGIYRICGRVWAATSAAVIADAVSVCTRTRPFRLLFFSDDNEINTKAGEAITDEMDKIPGGIVGFNLQWTQLSC